jgi:NitT/TauT family transport system substrate-binding protein
MSTVLGAAALAAAPRRGRAANTELRIATLPVDPAACAYYGKALGFFQAVGLDPQIQVIQSGAAIVTALVAGSIDIGWSSPVSVATAHLRGLPIEFVAPGGLYVRGHQTAGVVVTDDSPLRTARDLEGKILAVDTLRTAGEFASKLWMAQNGADPTKLSVVEVPFPAMGAALAQSRIDAAFSAEPFITESKTRLRFFADAFSAVGPRFYVGAWVSTQQWADAHRDLIEKFNAVVSKAATWANDHHRESAVILSNYSGIDLATTQKMSRVIYGTRLLASDIQPPIDLALRTGLLKAPVRAEDVMIPV